MRAVVTCTSYDDAMSLMSFERNVKLSVLLNGPLEAAQCRGGAQQRKIEILLQDEDARSSATKHLAWAVSFQRGTFRAVFTRFWPHPGVERVFLYTRVTRPVGAGPDSRRFGDVRKTITPYARRVGATFGKRSPQKR